MNKIKPPSGYENDELIITVLNLFEIKQRMTWTEIYKGTSSNLRRTVNRTTLNNRLDVLADKRMIEKKPGKRSPYVLIKDSSSLKVLESPTELDTLIIELCKDFLRDWHRLSDLWNDWDESAYQYRINEKHADEELTLNVLKRGGYDIARLTDERIIEKVWTLSNERTRLKVRAIELYKMICEFERRRNMNITRPWGDDIEMHAIAKGGIFDDDRPHGDRVYWNPTFDEYSMLFANAIDEIGSWGTDGKKTLLLESKRAKREPGRPKKSY